MEQQTAGGKLQQAKVALARRRLELYREKLLNQGSGFVESALGKAADAVEGVTNFTRNLITGDDRREYDYPELPAFMTPRGVSRSRMSLGRSDLQKLDILSTATDDDWQGTSDSFGNVYVDVDEGRGKRHGVKPGKYYLNRPGLSSQDMDDLMTTGAIEAVSTLGSAKVLGKVLPFGQYIGAGAGAAGGLHIQDRLADTAGSKQPHDNTDYLVGGAFGTGGAVIGRVVAPLFNSIFSRGGYTPGKGFDDDAKRALKRLGVDPESLSPEWLEQFQKQAEDAVTPSAAAKLADAQSLPVEVPLSRGDISRDVTQQRFEDQAQKGILGDGAKSVMETHRAAQQEALRSNAEAIQDQIGTGRRLAPGEGMGGVQERLSGDAAALKSAARKAYDPTTARARVDAPALGDFLKATADDVSRQFPSPEVNSRALDYVRRLEGLTQGPGGTTVKGVDFKALEAWRQDLGGARRAAERSSANAREAVALGSVMDRFDSFVDDAMEGALITGDKATIDSLKSARSLWREYKSKYDNKDAPFIRDIIGEDVNSGMMPPEEALRLLFGASGIGLKKGAGSTALRLRQVLGADSPEWAGLREEGVIRLMRSGLSNTRDAAGNLEFSGDRFSKELRKNMTDNVTMMRILFSRKELDMLRQFERVALLATNRRAGAVNHSGTSYGAAQWLNSVLGQTPTGRLMMGVVSRFLGGVSDAAAAGRAASNVARPSGAGSSTRLPGAMAVGGGVGAGEVSEKP